MINLIPPYAKKKLLLEYWARVSTVWLLLLGIAFLAGAIALAPSYVFIAKQIDSSAQAAESAEKNVASYEAVTQELVQAGQLAAFIKAQSVDQRVSTYEQLIVSYTDATIELTGIDLRRVEKGFGPARVMGIAADRRALTSFRDRLLTDPVIAEADFPIENLARDQDISFTITVTFTTSDV